MNILRKCLMALFILPTAVLAAGGDDPLLAKLMVDRLEKQSGDGPDPWVLEADLWIGHDLNKLWLKTDMEQVDGEVEEQELQLLYSRAISPYWDLQLGARRDLKPEPEKDWAVIGLHGVAPYFVESDLSLHFGEGEQVELRLQAERELMFTQRLVLTPELELKAFRNSDVAEGIGSGLSSATFGLRLGYELRREFAPYIGVTWRGVFGETADLVEQAGGEVSEARYVAGIRFWL